jgi:hypothetical protein
MPHKLPPFTISNPDALDPKKVCAIIDSIYPFVMSLIPTNFSSAQKLKMAVALAHQLGRTSMNAWHEGHTDVRRSKAAKITAAKKTEWHKSAKLIYEEQRKTSPAASADSIATIIVERLGPIRAITTIRNKIYKWDFERSSLPVS